MTINEMLTELSNRLDDVSLDRYTSAIKLAALNTQQSEVATLVHSGLLQSLQTSSTMTVPATGYTLPTNYLRYTHSELYQLYPVKAITKVNVDDLGIIQDNQYSRGSDIDPVCYTWSGVYYLKVTTYSGNYNVVKMYYIKKPTNMTAIDSACELHSVLHKVLLDLAEAELRATYKYGSFEEVGKLRDRAEMRIREINGEYQQGKIV